MREKLLLGVSNNNKIVFGEIKVRTWNEYPEFSASFNTVRPFNGNSFDIEEYFEDEIEYLDSTTILDLLKYHDCPYSELAENMAEECCDARDCLDCSFYPEEIEVENPHRENESWYFESMSGGQHDTRKEGMAVYTDKALYDRIHKLWDEYHLKKVDKNIIEEVEEIHKELSKIDIEGWIKNYIEEHYEDFE